MPILVTHVKNEDSELVTLKIEDFTDMLNETKGLQKKYDNLEAYASNLER